jgi:hypothetical protein
MMNRTRTIHLVLNHPFMIPGDAAPLPGGDYAVTIEEERLDQLSFEAWKRTGTWIVVRGTGAMAGRVELRPVTVEDLDHIVATDNTTRDLTRNGEAAPVPLEDEE